MGDVRNQASVYQAPILLSMNATALSTQYPCDIVTTQTIKYTFILFHIFFSKQGFFFITKQTLAIADEKKWEEEEEEEKEEDEEKENEKISRGSADTANIPAQSTSTSVLLNT